MSNNQDDHEDPLAPGRGCVVALALGAVIWIIGYVIYRVVTS